MDFYSQIFKEKCKKLKNFIENKISLRIWLRIIEIKNKLCVIKYGISWMHEITLQINPHFQRHLVHQKSYFNNFNNPFENHTCFLNLLALLTFNLLWLIFLRTIIIFLITSVEQIHCTEILVKLRNSVIVKKMPEKLLKSFGKI